jgi:Tol biopolymer transport system component
MVPVQKIQDAIGYAIQIGEALQEAHSHGVVHRDIKTENIMVNAKNQIKVMDFGLAKLKGSLKLTKTSSTAGTLAYMSPEQIQGGAVDARSDIFSFGVVLYEMLAGHTPFRGEYEAAMMYSIVNEEPEPIQKYRPDLSSEFLHIMNRALEKDAEDRYQTVHDMVIDLRRVKKETSRVSRVPITHPAVEEGRGIVSEEQRAATTVRRKNPKRTLLLVGPASALVLIVVIALLTALPSSAPKLNPDMTYRALPIPFNEVGGAGLSSDGNWAAYPVYDANNKYDIYYRNTTSGESRRITTDSSPWMAIADISPDGSQIVYDRYNYSTDRMEIAIVSSIGGSSRLIVDAGRLPQWRPDGQRIGYMRVKDHKSLSGKTEFWSVKPNGSDNRRVLIDSVSDTPAPFAWSPDGQSICFQKRFSRLWREIFMYELSTGKERQLTFDKKMILDVCWAPNDQIIYSSNRSGNYNLWMVPASGGPAMQITKGAGPDYGVDISRDGSKMLCLQQQEISHIWIAGTDGNNPHQITFDDVFIWTVAFSPDGKEIVFAYYQPMDEEKGAFVCSVDRDGGNRKILTSGEEGLGNPLPSPDGRWILYGGYPISASRDSMKIYLIDAKNPGIPKLIGKGCPMIWIDEKTFVSFRFRNSSNCYWLNSIEDGESRKIFEDSTYAIPLKGGKYICYYDLRSGRQGLWVCTGPGVKDPQLPARKKLAEGSLNCELDKKGIFAYYVKNAGELRRIAIPSGKEEVIRGIFPGLNPDFEHSTFDISYDGKDIVYTDQRYNSKLVMIENPFK